MKLVESVVKEDGVASMGELRILRNVSKTIAELGVGLPGWNRNIHGKYPCWLGWSEPLNVWGEIQDVTNRKPLVLHGGSGIPADQIAKAISLGCFKINANTELQLVIADATRQYVEAEKDLEGKGYDP